MNTTAAYRESNAWLQPGANAPLDTVSLQGPAEAAFAIGECRLGLSQLFGRDICVADGGYEVRLSLTPAHPAEGYALTGSESRLDIEASDTSGLLYGVYAFLASLRLGADPRGLMHRAAPALSRRVLNHWDNMDGSVERGYSGASLFFRDDMLSFDADRMTAYARMLASIGINELSINNVNVTSHSARLLTEAFLPELAVLADMFRSFGIRMIIAVHFESPMLLGGLPTADPLDARVARWWRDAADVVYRHIPDLSGFVVKADSEFRNGPESYGRTQADGANAIARALAPHGGIVYWRCFVYDCAQDWRDIKTDRAMAAFSHFHPLDGAFDDNIILQIKYGPTDFQVREPNSPIFGAMPQTKQAIEFQITQEYTGQQIDLYAWPVQWQEIFDAPVSDCRDMRSLAGREVQAIAAVSNVGSDDNWTGHTLAQANLFAYGRMAWNPARTAQDVLAEWVSLTFGNTQANGHIVDMLMRSRAIYEAYNAPLGIGWMVNVGRHYGPSVDGYEYTRWGTYHRADHRAIGVDRTETGTGFVSQYHPSVAEIYKRIETCPQPLLLFFHRLPYDHRLPCGRTLLQYIYDTHFEGVEAVKGLIATWESLRPDLPSCAYLSVLDRLHRQLDNAREWRDVVNTYFYRKTGIADANGRRIYA